MDKAADAPLGGRAASPGAILPTMRILEVETFGQGGLIHYAHLLAGALAERGHEVIVVTAVGYELEGRRELPAGVRVVRKTARLSRRPRDGGRRRPWPRFALALARKVEAVVDAFVVAALARRLRPDVVHLHSTNPIVLLHLLLLRLLGLPVVATAHQVTPHEPIPFQALVQRGIHRLPRRVIAHSEVDRRRLVEELGVEPRRIAVIPHGEYGFFAGDGEEPIDPGAARRELGLAEDEETVLFFGYLREYKGLDVLFDAWPAVAEARLARDGRRARLLVAGNPVQLAPARRRELEARAESLDAVRHFDYVPFTEVSRWFAAADVVALPYRQISQSGVLYLALALGVPVVATGVGGLGEVLRDGESALVVPPGDPEALTRALVRLLEDPELRERLACGGRRLAGEHAWPALAKRTEAVFLDLADRDGPRTRLP